VACAVVVGGAGLLAGVGFVANVALVLFAMLFIPAMLALGAAFLVTLCPATAALHAPLWTLSQGLLHGLDRLVRLWPDDPRWLLAAAVVLAVGAWLAVRSVWLAAGVGETLLAMQARAPAPADPEERQLVNVVEEMAIASGIPPPAVRLLDGSGANAAALGTGLGDCHLVVGRRLLDEFDREETQGLLAHLVGSVGNGDLRGAAHVHALLYALELMIIVVLAPFARWPRRVALRWLGSPLSAPFRSRPARAERARALIRLLEAHRGRLAAGGDDPAARLGRAYFGPIGAVVVRAIPPLLALLMLAQAATQFLLLLASLPVALLWRSRRYLADATAVQLTRHPTGLHRGLAHLAAAGGAIPGGEAAAHLFIVAPPPARGRASFWERQGLLMGMHPRVERRLRRLARMGAAPPATPGPAGHD
jgi:Zn-dependent protease with chaperone function